jgi:cysteinyl-tRNA synthetase
MLRGHYRSPVEVTRTNIDDASTSLDRLDTFVRRAGELAPGEPDAAALDELRRLMDDDLNTPGVFALLFNLVREGNRALDADDDLGAATALATVRELARAVGLPLHEPAESLPADALALAAARDEARAAKDWPRADEIRDQLVAMGYVVEDTPAGTHLRSA